MYPEDPERAGGLHPLYGRHYHKHGAQPGLSRAQRKHHKSILLLSGLDAVMRTYGGHIEETRLAHLHDRVLTLLRHALRDEWTRDDAIACALTLAAGLESEH
jgi:hypothetical protein